VLCSLLDHAWQRLYDHLTAFGVNVLDDVFYRRNKDLPGVWSPDHVDVVGASLEDVHNAAQIGSR